MADLKPTQRWYQGISNYQWLVLLIASLGWVFDIFEGQIFVASMQDAMPSLLDVGPDSPIVTSWNDRALASFLLGGAFGGVLFGMLSDKIGRSKTMIFTILFYSLFTCVTAFAQAPWHVVVLRFFVAMGVGGEWAVASAMVAEVMPKRSRPVMSSIFHASSVFGTLLAAAAGAYIIGNPALDNLIPGVSGWRISFAIGVFPALLCVFVRWKMREPEQWEKAKKKAEADPSQATGAIVDLFSRDNIRNTFVGVSLASIGLVTFWGGHIYGKNALMRRAQADVLAGAGISADAAKEVKQAAFEEHKSEIKSAEMLSMCLNTIGGGLGLVLFGPISMRLGRKGAFILYHLIGFGMVLVLFQGLLANDASATTLAIALPFFGFFTLGMHAGYAVYFPELYPTRLRGTGSGFCFNMGRLATAAAIFGFAMWNSYAGESDAITAVSQELKALLISPLYLVGIVIVLFARETRGEDLQE